MQTQIPSKAERTKQADQAMQQPTQLHTGTNLLFADSRSVTTQLKSVQTFLAQSPQNKGLHALQAKMNNHQVTPLNIAASLSAGVVQAKTDVKENKNDATSTETASKKIATPTQGTKWFRFNINDNVIDSFSNNIYPHSTDKGSNPVQTSVEIGAQATKESIDPSLLGGMSRPRHFGLGDRAIGKSTSDRKGKLTWHHQMGRYNMELVDMYVHGGFGHHGGYANWSEDDDDADGE